MTRESVVSDDAADGTLAAIVASASVLVAQFPECFWYWRSDVRLLSFEDARLVVVHLRKYGNREAWIAAQQLAQCLSANSRKPS